MFYLQEKIKADEVAVSRPLSTGIGVLQRDKPLQLSKRRGSRPLSTGIGVLQSGEFNMLNEVERSRPLSTGIGVLLR